MVPFEKWSVRIGALVWIAVAVLALVSAGGTIARRLYISHLYRQAGIQGHCHGNPAGQCSPDIWHEVASASDAFNHAPWADEFWREMRTRAEHKFPYQPFLIWGDSEFHSRYLNVDAGATGNWRRTVADGQGGCGNAGTLDVWIFGGSTVFGYRAPDTETLASQLTRELRRQTGRCVRVRNFGIEGFTSDQSLVALLMQLRSGERPDIVIDYEGVNDCTAGGYSPGVPGGHLRMVETKANFEERVGDDFRVWAADTDVARGVLRLGHMISGDTERRVLTISADDRITVVRLTNQEIERRANAVVENYGRNVAVLNLLARAFGFKAYAFWHPVLYYGRTPDSKFEHEALDVLLRNADHDRIVADIYRLAEQRAPQLGFISLAHAVDGVQGTVYIDTMHLSPAGNAIVAARIAQVISAR